MYDNFLIRKDSLKNDVDENLKKEQAKVSDDVD